MKGSVSEGLRSLYSGEEHGEMKGSVQTQTRSSRIPVLDVWSLLNVTTQYWYYVWSQLLELRFRGTDVNPFPVEWKIII